MKIAYTTTFDANDVRQWSGTPFHMSRALETEGLGVERIGSLKRQLPPFFKLKQTWQKWVCNQRVSPRFNITAAKYYSHQVAEQLKHREVDAIVSPLINPIAYLDTDKPLVLWTDGLYASLLGFYPPFAYHSAETIHQGNAITREALSRCTYAVFSSDWAARSAIEIYGVSQDKVKVVPFGANLETYPSESDIERFIQRRDHKVIKLLFLAKSWERKGGDVVVAVAKALHDAGHAVECHIIGYDHIPHQKTIPPYVRCHGFIAKNTAEGKARLQQLLSESHFLFVPSRAEAYGIVFCEANAYGVPCLSTTVGGINTVIRPGENGYTFGLDVSPETYAAHIVRLMQDRAGYETLARSSYQAFMTRLNWKVNAATVADLLRGARR